MPIYDYQCTSCGFKKEVMRKISEPNLTVCPECGKETFAKQLSAPSFQLSGSGWYATDFKGGTSKGDSAKLEKKDDSEKKTESTEAAVPAAPCAPGCACH
ncbi:MAG TPA: zinc ribbon domain-containing protein [Methylophilaceae bacterium]|nr:zinc ribbon domain-containing protein [Methylophilaceae bacterium]